MKKSALFLLAMLSIFSCKSKKAVENPENLPKDVSLKPKRADISNIDRENLGKIRAEIDSLLALEPCSDAKKWRISPIGSKACGGPASYLAYPIEKEKDYVEKIRNYTDLESAFNRKYNIVSDCAMVMPPVSIECVDGKLKLISANEAAAQ